MDKENVFNFPNDFPYEFASTDDQQITGLTRSISLQQPSYNFKEPTLGRSSCIYSQASSPPLYVKGGEDAWNVIHAAAGQVAEMRIRMRNNDVTGVPLAFNRPHHSSWQGSDRVELLLKQHFCQNRGASAWSPPQVHTQCQGKPVADTPVKRECAGTGVFLPRRYCNNSPESRTRQGSPSNLATRMIQYSTKSFIPITALPLIQTHINSGFISHYDLFMDRSKAKILAAQQRRRSNIDNGVVMELAMNNPAVLLPQEWTY